MRVFLAVTSVLALLGSCLTYGAAPAGQLKSDWNSFKRWAKLHNKQYLQDPKELSHRFQIWSDNVARINQRAASNAANGITHTLGLTAHTDLTSEEFRAKYLGVPIFPLDRIAQHQQQTIIQKNEPHQQEQRAQHTQPNKIQAACIWLSQLFTGQTHPLPPLRTSPPNKPSQQQHTVSKKDKPQHWRYENVTAPAAVDWRQHQPTVLGAIKDQHVNGTPCGSCWAFSAVSIMEIASAMATGKVVLGSEQQLIDCDRKYDHGCAGGGWLNAIQYTIKNKGLATEEQYPYTGKDGHCKKHLANERHELRVDSWEDVPFSNESALAQAVSQTPVIVAICAGPAIDDWHHYAGGIFDAPCCEKDKEITLDHGIVVVGYGTENGKDFWILKNSWGQQWGEQGFMRISRNHGKHGKCALASYPAMVFRKPLPDGDKPAAVQEGLTAALQSVV